MKLSKDEIIDILVEIDTLVKTNNIHVTSLFINDTFNLNNLKVLESTSKFLYNYFADYTLGEFLHWVKKNINFYNDFKQKENINRPNAVRSCYNTLTVIDMASKWIYSMLQKIISNSDYYLEITFSRNEYKCDKSTYFDILNNFDLSSNYYMGIRDTFESLQDFKLCITVLDNSVKIKIEGVDDLYIYQASTQIYDIYYEDIDIQWPNNYAAIVQKYHYDDYIWLYKSSFKTNPEDIQALIKCVMFACHFPIFISNSTIVPIYSIKSYRKSKPESNIDNNFIIKSKSKLAIISPTNSNSANSVTNSDTSVNSANSSKYGKKEYNVRNVALNKYAKNPNINLNQRTPAPYKPLGLLLPKPQWNNNKNNNIQDNNVNISKNANKNKNVNTNKSLNLLLPASQWKDKENQANKENNEFESLLPKPQWKKQGNLIPTAPGKVWSGGKNNNKK